LLLTSSCRFIVCFLHAETPFIHWHNLQSSGVTLSSNALSTYTTPGNRWKYIIFGLSSNNREIRSLKESNEDDYDKFLEEFPEDECRWAVYKYDYDSGEGRRTKVVFFHWCAPIRSQKLED